MDEEKATMTTSTISTQSPEREIAEFSVEDIRRLQEELELTRRENKQCWQNVQHLETSLARMRSNAQCSKDERERLKKKLRELQIRLSASTTAPSPNPPFVELRDQSAADKTDQNPSSSTKCVVNQPIAETMTLEFRSPTLAVTPKMAERVRLKRFPSDDVHGAEICSLGISNVRLAEHLSENIQEASQLQELYRSLVSAARKQEFEIELENLRRQANRMKSQISFLELTLNESRTLADNLSSLCAQMESNETASHLALLFDDYIEQTSDCLLRLADSQLAFVLASCQAVHCSPVARGGGRTNDDELILLARKERERAEYDAKNLLRRLELDCTTLIADNLQRFGSTGDEDVIIEEPPSPKEKERAWTRGDEIRLRSLVRIMKTHRDAIRRSAVEVQSASSALNAAYRGQDRGESKPISSLQEEKLSLENVVLLQELMAIKEEKTQLKAKSMILEKENEILALTVRGKDLQLASLRGSTENSESKPDSDQPPTESDQLTPAQLTESILVNQVVLQRKSEYLIEHLKRINFSLMAKLERSKRKHKAKLRRLQQALRYVSEQYELEISTIRAQMSTSSMEIAAARDSGNETVWSHHSSEA